MTVWILTEKLLSNSTGDPDVELRSWLLSFFTIPTIHERYGDGSSRATIVHTIARQEQDAAVEGVSTMDWITIILSERPGAGLSVKGMSRRTLVATLREMTGLYEALPEVQAYDDVVTTPPTKKRAKTARVVNDEAEAKGIRMGNRKLKAITHFLEHGTGEMFEAIMKHLQHHSWKSCALSDALLASPWIYPDLRPDDEPGATTSDSANESRFAPRAQSRHHWSTRRS